MYCLIKYTCLYIYMYLVIKKQSVIFTHQCCNVTCHNIHVHYTQLFMWDFIFCCSDFLRQSCICNVENSICKHVPFSNVCLCVHTCTPNIFHSNMLICIPLIILDYFRINMIVIIIFSMLLIHECTCTCLLLLEKRRI